MDICVFTGAGISAESGIPTYRDSNGLWYEHDPKEVATAYALTKDPTRVFNFFNMMRKRMKDVQPNAAHFNIRALEKDHNVQVITQNVDDLHEKAGSTRVLHLHGEITKLRNSKKSPADIHRYAYDHDVIVGEKCPITGTQLRPDVVLFGEPVPKFELALDQIDIFDALIIIGTSLDVYPANNIAIEFIKSGNPIIFIDPNPTWANRYTRANIRFIREKASTGTAQLKEILDTLVRK